MFKLPHTRVEVTKKKKKKKKVPRNESNPGIKHLKAAQMRRRKKQQTARTARENAEDSAEASAEASGSDTRPVEQKKKKIKLTLAELTAKTEQREERSFMRLTNKEIRLVYHRLLDGGGELYKKADEIGKTKGRPEGGKIKVALGKGRKAVVYCGRNHVSPSDYEHAAGRIYATVCSNPKLKSCRRSKGSPRWGAFSGWHHTESCGSIEQRTRTREDRLYAIRMYRVKLTEDKYMFLTNVYRIQEDVAKKRLEALKSRKKRKRPVKKSVKSKKKQRTLGSD